MESESRSKSDIALGFDLFSVKVDHPAKYLLRNVSGYVRKGCITALLGPSASGKSVLMQALSGRLQSLNITGDVVIHDARANPKSVHNPIAYVPQEDSTIGELTAREMTMNTALLKKNEPATALKEEVNKMMDDLGLSKVADGIIGTLIFRGLSGGQKKRVEVATELIAHPEILFLDEPTSGLDSTIALEVLNAIRTLVKKSNGELSVVMSIHQPNGHMLELFDDIMLLDGGQTTFFGTVPQALAYFGSIGYACPDNVTSTDYFLQVTDTKFSYHDAETDFIAAFRASDLYDSLRAPLKDAVASADKSAQRVKEMGHDVSCFKRFWVLVYREFALAYRDPTLYYFQVVMILTFSFLSGAVFFQIPKRVDGNFHYFISGIVWLVFMNSWIHIFKVYHIVRNDARAKHEISNGKYSPMTFFLADSVSTALLITCLFIPPPLGYFMMGFPGIGYPFLILNFWMTSLTTEAMLSLICKFSKNPVVAMIACQIALLTLMVFSGGLFLRWPDCPPWWIWLQEATVFTQSSRAGQMEVFSHMELDCTTADANCDCIDPFSADAYTCKAGTCDVAAETCVVTAREILSVTQDIGTNESYWTYFGYLSCIYVVLKIFCCFLVHYPWEQLTYAVYNKFAAKEDIEVPNSYAPGVVGLNGENSFGVAPHSAAEDKEKGVELAAANSPANADLTASPGKMEESKASTKPSQKTSQKASQKAASLKEKLASFRSIAQVNMSDKSSEKAALAWTDMTVTLPKKNQRIISNVSGYVESGRILALMGPSGAGKTTLLNALCKRAAYAKVDGKVMFAGRKLTPADLTYVPQFDHANRSLTVEEHLQLVGKLTGPNSEENAMRVDMLLDVLGLADKKNLRVEVLTGGEVKRVCVGVGMMSNPNVLFLDEPTTGLDSTAAFSIVQYLECLAKATNVAVIMTIHQPSALMFDLLDDLLLLEGGHTVYGGALSNARVYFESIGCPNTEDINYADFYLDLVQAPHSSGTSWDELFAKSAAAAEFNENISEAVTSKVNKNPPVMPGMVSRAAAMFEYFMLYFAREKGFYVYRTLMLIVLALFTGSLYYNLQPETDELANYAGALFYSCTVVLLSAVASTAIFARDRREAVDRVKNDIYPPGIFVVSQFLASSIYNIFVAFIYVCVYHWLTHINPSAESFLYDLCISWSFLLLQESALMMIIEILKNEFLCTTFGLVFIGSLMLVSGFFRKTDEMPKWIFWMSYMMPLKYGFDGFTWMVFSDQTFTVSGTTDTVAGTTILEEVYGLNRNNTDPWGFFGAMLAYVVLLRGTQYFLFAVQTGAIPMPAVEMPTCCSGSKEPQIHSNEDQIGSPDRVPELGMEMPAQRA